MSALAEKVRRCDNFGARFSFSYKGAGTFGTLVGGVSSICLRILILTFMIVRTIDLVSYNDPDISSYVIMEDRSRMQNHYNM